MNKEYMKSCLERYKHDLLEDNIPFWIRHSIDREDGGYMFCLNQDGSVMDTVKAVWLQGRFAWMLATLYNEVEKRQEWLELSKHGIDFLEKYAFDPADRRMYFLLNKDGSPLRKRRYIFSETFCAIAFATYSKASGDTSYAHKAVDLFKFILHYKNTPGLLPSKNIEEVLSTKGHSLCMILINTAYEIRKAINDTILTQQINESIKEIQQDFMHNEFQCLLEKVTTEGKFIDSNEGRCINPGHSIETAWFILEEAKYRNWDKELIKTGLQILDWSWQWGWDKEYGGISYFKDCKHIPPQEYWHDMKFWWPQNETVIATLYAYQASGNEKYLQWHKQIHDYAFALFPDKEYGEWFGYFHRDGRLSQSAKGNIYKGCFHVPRMLLKGWQLSQEILENKTSNL